MKKFRALKSVLLFALITSLVTFFVSTLSFQSKAASLSDLYVYLSRLEANVTGSAETLEIVLAINTTTTIPTGGTVTLYFPDADDAMWCRTAGTLTVAGVAASAADLAATDWDIDEVLPTSGTLAAACTQGSGGSSVDTITISNVGSLTAGTTYGVKISNGTTAGVIGTDDTTGAHEITVEAKSGSTIDSSTIKVSLIANDTVVVSATVSATPSVNCTISANTVNLGTLYPGGSYTTASTHTIGTDTSGTTAGYYWAAYGTGNGTDAGLYKSTPTTYLIASTGSTTVNLTTAGSEGFGIALSDPDGASEATVATNFSNATPGVYGALDPLPAGARMILYQNAAQPSNETSTVTYGARAGATAVAGAYQESVIYVCGGYY
ncbi:MAG TPA: hypothetical protein PKI16_02235 [Candidatus Dojkabacteria bacterium]|nr:hypothetical protein [Candidatus Dojkabacteria bacterium]